MGVGIDKAFNNIKKKARDKAGKLFGNDEIIIPDALLVEQASSLATAEFVASLIPKGSIGADLTAGFGVNTVCFSRKASEIYAIEREPSRAHALEKNLNSLEISNVHVISNDCIDWLKGFSKVIDWFFVDPARRGVGGKRLVRLEDCSPNVVDLLPLMKEKCGTVLIKCSPLLDLIESLRIFEALKHIYILEYKREVREIILELSFSEKVENVPLSVSCVILNDSIPPRIETFRMHEDKQDIGQLLFLNSKKDIEPGCYIYEPSPAFMKAALWNGMVKGFPNIKKFAPNTHLFYSAYYYPDFPGKVFEIKRLFSSKDLKLNKGGDYNVISRNHPAKAEELVTRYKFKSSEKNFLIACTIGNEKTIIQVVIM